VNEKSLLSLSVIRKFIFLYYTQDYSEKYIFHFTVPDPPLFQSVHLSNLDVTVAKERDYVSMELWLLTDLLYSPWMMHE
jgi:hypothetical protein